MRLSRKIGNACCASCTRVAASGARLPEHPALGRQAEEDLPDGFEMDRAALALLGPGVDVAQAALEWVLVEDRVRAGDVVDRRDDIARLLDGPGRGEAQLPVPFGREL